MNEVARSIQHAHLTSGYFRVQPARRLCGNPQPEETYGGLDKDSLVQLEGISNGEIVSTKNGFLTALGSEVDKRTCI
jgi:hypothetical protein